jgi:hemerythrin-like domain-containing protein
MPPAATDPLPDFFARLLADHARTEEELKRLDRASAAVAREENDPAALAQIAVTLAYFAGAGERHEALEEQALFPALRPLAEFKQILAALEFQHRMTAAEGRQLAACVENYRAGSGSELRRLAYRFAEMHRGHALAEERALFPLAKSRLTAEVLAGLARELQTRDAALGVGATKPR